MKSVVCLSVVLLAKYVISRCPPSDYYSIPSFGENCSYRCHCAADAQCNNVTGQCPGPCARGWMGPACQYRNVALNASNVIQNGNNVNPEAVNDGDYSTCSNLRQSDIRNEYFWRIELKRPFYIVGIVVHTLAGAQSTAVKIETSDVMNFSIGNQTCAKLFTVAGNDRIEVMCRQPVVARAMQIVNQGNQTTLSLCELEIYGGRHVSFSKNTTQESTITWNQVSWYSWLAVDGTGARNNNYGLTCSATTDSAGNKWWQLNLGTTYRMEDVYIFSRLDSPRQTKGFTMTVGENNTYKDTLTSNSPSDYLPWTLDLQQPVAGDYVHLNRSTIMTLCEVIVYAECLPGWCGWECSNVCMCTTLTTGSPRLEAVCPYGCQDGWSGTNGRCDKACNDGWFGQNCSTECGKCKGGGVNCDHVTGRCSDGCLPGYYHSDLKCMKACSAGWFGQNCSSVCGNCLGGVVNCDHVTGGCSLGCRPGYNNSDVKCIQFCSPGWFGQNCSSECGNCQGGGKLCDHVTGGCSAGCLAGYNHSDDTCMQECDNGTYSFNCSETCGYCKDSEPCDSETGSCPVDCDPGFIGRLCKEHCNPGWHGQNCLFECGSCQGGGVNCNHVTGLCSDGCLPGFNQSDSKCTKECDAGSFGDNCNETCGNCAQSHCHPVNGTCLAGCIEGYDGTTCRLKMEPLSGSKPEALIGGTVTGVLVIVIVALAVLLFLKRRRQQESSSDSVEFATSPLHHGALKPDFDESEEYVNYMVDEIQPEADPRTIAVSDLRQFVKNISQTKDKLAEDFKEIPRLFDLPRLAGQKINNIPKNKYKDILPYDSNRVKLPEIPDQEDSDYINANLILSSVGGRNYIASQGPSQRTLNDFWRMVWEESIGVIVILTNCFELGKVKCVRYWPDTDALTFGDLEVTLLSQTVYNEYTIRCLHCKKVGQDSGHDVMQFHFTAWPDKQVPETALSLVNFWRQVRTSDTDGLLHWLVHCSAGIGRTGTFIALDALYEKGRRNNKVNVYDYLTELRHQRQMMVQTAEQYVFLHLAVAEALVPLGTLCTAEAFPEQLAGLTASGPGQASQLQIEYEGVKSMTEEDCPDTEYGNLPIGMDLQRCAQSFLKENRDTSRDGQIVPPDEYRPRLGCHVDNRNDYINAVNMPTYGLGGGLILTQVPLPNTVVDFLRLVFTYDVKFVVLLESNVPQYCQFWPRAGYSTTFGPFTVIHVGESIHQYHTCWDLECLYKDRSIDVTVLQYTGTWQNDVMCPDEHDSFLEIVSAVDSTTDPSVLCKPIVVQCMDGNEKSGLFAALYTIIERIKCTGDVSIAETVLRIRGRRRQAICSVEQYQFLHNATRNYIDSLQVYANI